MNDFRTKRLPSFHWGDVCFQKKIFLTNCASLTHIEHLCLQQKFAKQGPQTKPSPLQCPAFFLLLFLGTLLPAWMVYPILISSPIDPYFIFKTLSSITSSELLFRQSCLYCLLYDNHSLYIIWLLNLSYNIANICLCQWFSEHLAVSGEFFLCHNLERRCYGSGGLRSGMMQNIL